VDALEKREVSCTCWESNVFEVVYILLSSDFLLFRLLQDLYIGLSSVLKEIVFMLLCVDVLRHSVLNCAEHHLNGSG
jgi:hypothetical protein